jgi:leucyl aminopeptidase
MCAASAPTLHREVFMQQPTPLPLETRPKLPALTLAALALALCAAPCAQAASTWITIGEAAHAVLQQAMPAARTLASVQVPVTVPTQRGSARQVSLVQAREGVHAVEIDEASIDELSTTLHERLHKCAGFVQHSSMAQALATLQQLTTPAQPTLVPSYVVDNQALVNAMLPQLQASNILSNIEQLASYQNRRYKSSSGVAASNDLRARWAAMGATRRDIRVRQVTHPNWSQKSVVLEWTGGGSNNGEVIVLGAHLDSIASGPMETARAPGADDDASGVATITEILRVLLASNYQPSRSLRFVAYAAEEVGLLGSQEIVANLRNERSRVVGVMQLDMTAYQGSATDLWIFTDYTNGAQNQFVADLAAAYLPSLSVGYDRCGYGCSDHASWYVAGYPASFPFESSDTSYNFQIHTPNDTTATFGNQANHALKFGQLALAYMVELGSDRGPATKAGVSLGAAPGASR